MSQNIDTYQNETVNVAKSPSFFFGYGSLVNKNTHTYDAAYPAELHGWRRAWRYAAGREACFLTVEPARGVTIQGLIAQISGSWEALDEREAAYERHLCTDSVRHTAPHPDASVSVYAVPNPISNPPAGARPILLSYLDVVVQGFLTVHGPDALSHFVDTTAGWDLPVLNDRAHPIYPRAQVLTRDETAAVDDLLRELGSRIVT